MVLNSAGRRIALLSLFVVASTMLPSCDGAAERGQTLGESIDAVGGDATAPSSAGLSGAPPAERAWPDISDGLPLTQIGVLDANPYDLEDKFLNLLRPQEGGWAAAKNWPDQSVMEFPALFAAGAIDRETLVPTRIPEGYDLVRSGLFRTGARFYPAYYGGTYVFDWEGEGEARCGFNQPTRKVGKNRIECVYSAAHTDWGRIELTRIGPGFSNPRLYRKENEARLDAEEIYDPKFLKHIGRYKIIRTMDIQDSNSSWVRSVDELATKKALAWGNKEYWSAERWSSGMPKGFPIEGLFDMAVAADTALWMIVPGIIGAPDVFIDEAATIRDYYPVETGRDRLIALARENAHEIAASPEWRRYADEIVRSLLASGYPETRTLYIELWNEVWNNANPWWRMTHYLVGLAEGIGDVEAYSSRYAYGYMAALFAHRFKAALDEQGRAQAWTIVLAGQMADPETTRAALFGFRRYFRDARVDPTPYLARAGVSTASYYGGALERGGLINADSDEAFRKKFLAEIAADPQGLAKRATDYIIHGPADKDGALPNLIARRKTHQRLAEQAGAFFLGDYEGESHETGGGALRREPAFVNWVESWVSGPEGERLTRAWAEALLAQNPNAVIANYLSIGLFDPEGAAPTDNRLAGPWVDGFWTDETGRQRGLAPYLRTRNR